MISEQAVERLDELLSVLGVELRREKRMYVGACPIHGGDRDNALNLFHSGNTMVGNWKCRSHQCHKTFQPTLIGFVRGVLSHKEHGWEQHNDDTYSFHDTIDFLTSFLNTDLDNFQVNLGEVEKRRAADHVVRFYARTNKIKTKVPREVIRKSIKTPQYYIDRGYSKEILDKYDVSMCDDPSKPMYKRCVAPIYTDDHQFMVGCTGRSIYEKCEECKSFHNPAMPCPDSEDLWRYSKWKHNYGFAAEDWLYNYWYAKSHVEKTNCAVLVESPGNVWRLEEAGIHTSMALFGTSLTPGQGDALNRCGAMNVLIAMDNDEAGLQAIQPLIDELSKLYNVDVLDVEDADIGSMSIEAIQRDLVPKITGAYLE